MARCFVSGVRRQMAAGGAIGLLRQMYRCPMVTNQQRSMYLYSPEPFHPIPHKQPKWMSAEEAVSYLTSGMRVYFTGLGSTPRLLMEAMCEHGLKNQLKNVEVIHLLIAGPATYTEEKYNGIFRGNNLFIGVNCRQSVNDGRADYTPISLGEIPLLFRRKIINLDVALIQVSPPDEHGFCTLGPCVDTSRAAIQNAKYIIGQVNEHMPRSFGDGVIHESHLDAMVEGHLPLPEIEDNLPSPAEKRIAKLIAENLVEDGATLQMGIGSIPNLVASKLAHHRDLGIHSEMIGDGIIKLVRSGAITNAKKVIETGKIVAGFAYGKKQLYDFIHDNPFVNLGDIGFVNNVAVIAQNPKVTAINACLEIDLTGQVVSDSIGTLLYSGVGGQIDFMRGAALGSDGLGKPILAMQSQTSGGVPKIVPFLKQGGGVVSTRAHVHYIVTEYGIVNLFGKNLRQRAYELIRIAHPDHREGLEKAAFERLKVIPSP